MSNGIWNVRRSPFRLHVAGTVMQLLLLAACTLSILSHAAQLPLVMSVNSSKKSQPIPGKKGTERSLSVEVRIQNPLNNEVKCRLEWFYVATLVDEFGYFVSTQGVEEITISPRGVFTTTKNAALLISARACDESVTPKKFVNAPAENKGFIVRLLSDQDELAIYGEPPFVRNKIKDRDGFRDFLLKIPTIPKKQEPLKLRR